MKQVHHALRVPTKGAGLYDITQDVLMFLRGVDVAEGLLTCFIRHTSASLVIQENADPDVQRDLTNFLAHLATSGPAFRHTTEGPDDMPSHIRAALTQTSITIPVTEGRPVLGTWQGIYVFEHRDAPHVRQVVLHIMA